MENSGMMNNVKVNSDLLNPVGNGLREFIQNFLSVSFFIFTLMYLVPGTKTFRPEAIWPFSYLKWLFDFILIQSDNIATIYTYYLRTCALVFGALGLLLLIVVLLYFIKHFFSGALTNVLFSLINFSSGFHIIVLSLAYYLLIRDVGYSFGVFLILAIGNGSLAEFYNTFESEMEKILKKEYVLAGSAWGFSTYRFPRREMFITIIEMVVARLPILFGSTIIVELIFSIRGISAAIYYAVKNQYFDTLIVSTVLIASTIILFNIIAEKVRWYLDPRVRHGNY